MSAYALAHRRETDRQPPQFLSATSDQDLFDQMTTLYPDWATNQSWLMFGFPRA
jgi:hypothetical protein